MIRAALVIALLFSAAPAFTQGPVAVTQWVNSEPPQTIAPGTGNAFHRVATLSFTVTQPSTVMVTGISEVFLNACAGAACGGTSFMGGSYRVGFGNSLSTVRFSNVLNSGSLGAAWLSSNLVMPLSTTAVATNVQPGTYQAYIAFFANEGNGFRTFEYHAKQLIVQVIRN